MRRQRACADVEHDRQPLSGNGVKDFFHQDQALARSEIRDAAAGYREPFASARCAMLGFRLDKSQLLAPKITFTIGHFGLISTAHGRGRSYWISTRTLCDMSVDPDDHSCAVRSCRNARKWRLMFAGG